MLAHAMNEAAHLFPDLVWRILTAAACARIRGRHIHASLCMRCARHPAVTMLSGYVLPVAPCDGCGYVSDLAMVRIAQPFTTSVRAAFPAWQPR